MLPDGEPERPEESSSMGRGAAGKGDASGRVAGELSRESDQKKVLCRSFCEGDGYFTRNRL